MRGFLTAFFAGAALICAAQTAESPMVVTLGDNSCKVESWSTTYFSYTPATDQIVTVNGIESNLSVTCDDKKVANAYLSNSKENIFAVKGGEKYLFTYFSMSEATLNFSVSAVEKPYVDGKSCDQAVEAGAEEFFVPFVSEGFMSKTPIYIKYTAPSDGRLTMTFTSTLSDLAIAEGCGGEFTPLSGGSSTADYRWQISTEVDEDVVYILRASSSSGMMATFVTEQPEPGSSCIDAWTAKRGENVIPAEAGKYWYRFDTPKAPAKGFLMLTSDSKLPDGKITVKTSCSSDFGDVSLNGEIALRLPVTAEDFRAICIEKALATPSEEKFNIALQDYQTYDDFYTAEPLEAGVQTTTPDFGGTYYYSIAAPEKGNWFLDLSSLSESLPEGTSVELYDAEKDFLTLASGTGSLHYEVTPAVEYVIKWKCPDTLRALPFTVNFNAVKEGETEKNPLKAVLGENNIPESVKVYFSYTAAGNSWLVVTPENSDLKPQVSYISADGYKSGVSLFPTSGGSYRFEAVKGTDYLFEFQAEGKPSSFMLEEEAYAPGEAVDTAIEVEGDKVDLSSLSGQIWYKYEAESDGVLELSTTLKYVYTNNIYIYPGEVTVDNRQTMSPESYGSDVYRKISLDVTAGDVVYVNIKVTESQDGTAFMFNLREAAPGETAASAILIDFNENPMTYSFDKTVGYDDKPVWYGIDITDEIFNLESEATFKMALFSADDTENAVGESSGSMFGPNALKNIIVPAPGKYLIKLISSSNAFTATLSQREAAEGETPSTAIRITSETVPFSYTFPAVGYGESPVWFCIKLKPGDFNLAYTETATMKMYASDNYSTPFAQPQFDYSSGTYMINNLTIEQEGLYYFKLESAYKEYDATFSGSAIVTGSTGVEAIETSESPAEYYDLQGVRVMNPSKGIHIKIQDGKQSKVMF